MVRPRPKVEDRPADKASAHFVALEIALSRGDYAAAAQAQRTLAELGWEIRLRHPRGSLVGEGVATQ
ncbi:MAG: hypothetical protein JO284_09755 [Planctomycetaceae bacterium]|nr:hypothetical protein [Planctomycetaceae bacterium]